jgi:hypothetical protein
MDSACSPDTNLLLDTILLYRIQDAPTLFIFKEKIVRQERIERVLSSIPADAFIELIREAGGPPDAGPEYFPVSLFGTGPLAAVTATVDGLTTKLHRTRQPNRFLFRQQWMAKNSAFIVLQPDVNSFQQ